MSKNMLACVQLMFLKIFRNMHLINCLKHTLFFSSFRLCFWLLKCSVDVLVLLFLQIWKKHEIIIDCNVDFLVDFCRMKFVNHVVTNFFVYNEIILEYFWICCHFSIDDEKPSVIYICCSMDSRNKKMPKSAKHGPLHSSEGFLIFLFEIYELRNHYRLPCVLHLPMLLHIF